MRNADMVHTEAVIKFRNVVNGLLLVFLAYIYCTVDHMCRNFHGLMINRFIRQNIKAFSFSLSLSQYFAISVWNLTGLESVILQMFLFDRTLVYPLLWALERIPLPIYFEQMFNIRKWAWLHRSLLRKLLNKHKTGPHIPQWMRRSILYGKRLVARLDVYLLALA